MTKKCTLFFLPANDLKSFLSLFPLLQFFTFLNELCQLVILKVLNHPVTLFSCILGFIGGNVDTALNNTRFMTSPSELIKFLIQLPLISIFTFVRSRGDLKEKNCRD